MDTQLPNHIELTVQEQELLERIEFEPHRMGLGQRFEEVVRESCAAAKALTLSLLERSAIPPIRWAYFTDARYNIGSKKSVQEVFESNRTYGDRIFEHPHFLKYLKYFVFGPDLPERTIRGFCRILDEDAGTTGMLLDSLRRFARSSIREFYLDRKYAAEEFFKLCLECQLREHFARSIRDAAMQTR
jgi:hypothetical protein